MAIVEVWLNQTDVKRFEADGWTLEYDDPRPTVLAVHRVNDDGTYEIGYRVRAGEFSSVGFAEDEAAAVDDWAALPPPVILPSGMVTCPEKAFDPVTPPKDTPAPPAPKGA